MDREVSFSGLLSETAALIGDGIRPIAIYVVAIGGLNALGAIAGFAQLGQTAQVGFFLDANRGLASALFQVFELLVSVTAGYLLSAELLKTRVTLAEGSPRILAYFGMSILYVLGVILGFILLVIPGIIIIVRWSAATGFLIGGGESVGDALGRSWDATRGHSWPIFFAGVVMFVCFALGGGALGLTMGLTGSSNIATIATALVNEIGTAVSAAFAIAVYVLVHDDREELGDVFA